MRQERSLNREEISEEQRERHSPEAAFLRVEKIPMPNRQNVELRDKTDKFGVSKNEVVLYGRLQDQQAKKQKSLFPTTKEKDMERAGPEMRLISDPIENEIPRGAFDP